MDHIESEQPKFKRHAIVAAVLLIVWTGAAIIAGILKVSRIEYIALAGALGGVILVIAIAISLTRLSGAKRDDTLRELGFKVLPTVVKFWKGKTTELPPLIWAFFRDAAGVGVQGQVFFAAHRENETGECWIIRHMIQHGKSATIRNIFLIPHSTRWPLCKIHKRGVTDMLRKVFGEKPLILPDASFNEQVTVICQDEEFANLLIGPELAQIALALKSYDQIVIGSGGACIISMSMLTEEKLRQMVELVGQVRGAIPPELSVWEPTATQETL